MYDHILGLFEGAGFVPSENVLTYMSLSYQDIIPLSKKQSKYHDLIRKYHFKSSLRGQLVKEGYLWSKVVCDKGIN